MSNDNDTALVVGEKSGELVNPSQFEAWAEVFVKSGLFAPPEGGRAALCRVCCAAALPGRRAQGASTPAAARRSSR